MKHIKKSDLLNIDHHLLNDAFLSVQKKEKNPEKIPENKQKRDIIYFILSYQKKFQINIDNILSGSMFLELLQEKTDDLYDIGLFEKIQKILISSEEKNRLKVNQEFHEILDSTSQWFWVIDKNLVIQDVNESFCKMLGYKKSELIGKNIRDLFDDTNKAILDKQVKNIDSTSDRKYHIDFTRKDGSLLPVVLKATSLYDQNGVFRKAIAFITDITELRAYEQKLYDISIKDELTWIWNRRYFDEKLQQYFDEINSKKWEITTLCMGLIDIDFFKSINDTLGHDVGDIVLKELGKRFLHISKKNIEVFRIGWEEFGVIGTNISEEYFYEIINNFRLYNEQHPIEYPSGLVKFTISGGISFFDTTKNEKIPTSKALYKKTDILLYAAKHSGRNNIKTSQDI